MRAVPAVALLGVALLTSARAVHVTYERAAADSGAGARQAAARMTSGAKDAEPLAAPPPEAFRALPDLFGGDRAVGVPPARTAAHGSAAGRARTPAGGFAAAGDEAGLELPRVGARVAGAPAAPTQEPTVLPGDARRQVHNRVALLRADVDDVIVDGVPPPPQLAVALGRAKHPRWSEDNAIQLAIPEVFNISTPPSIQLADPMAVPLPLTPDPVHVDTDMAMPCAALAARDEEALLEMATVLHSVLGTAEFRDLQAASAEFLSIHAAVVDPPFLARLFASCWPSADAEDLRDAAALLTPKLVSALEKAQFLEQQSATKSAWFRTILARPSHLEPTAEIARLLPVRLEFAINQVARASDRPTKDELQCDGLVLGLEWLAQRYAGEKLKKCRSNR